MNQAFFTLNLGIGAMAIFGSYIGKDHSLLGESVRVVVLDTFVAITSGLIIFPACFTYNVDQTSGPSLIFITLPNIFANMGLGRLWGSLFFLFMSFAALSTVLAVFENIICCGMEITGCSRKKSGIVNLVLIIALSLPCVLGYNLWSWGRIRCVRRSDPGCGGLPCEQHIPAAGFSCILAVLCHKIRMGLEKLQRGSQYGPRTQGPRLDEIVSDIYTAADRTVHICVRHI